MPLKLESLHDYTLVICEKPDAAKRIADALAEDKLIEEDVDRIPIFLAKNSRGTFVVCSAVGHLYTIADPFQNRKIYPVFDVEWFPSHLVEKKSARVAKSIGVIKKLSERAGEFIHACDFDLEGETIGYNILKYACREKEKSALRAKFSTLTKDELQEAFKNARPGLGQRLAEAGRTRHLVDFIWGVNLSRALSEAFYVANNRYKMISVGRVQGPTLSYIVDREVEIRTYVPIPYWTVTAVIDKDGSRFVANYERSKIRRLSEALEIKKGCEGRDALIVEIRKSLVRLSPPTPFNVGDLQREAYRVFGYSPRQTLAIAERLYLDALISYPRTSSQKLPPTINYRKILSGLKQISVYRDDVAELLKGRLKPHEGGKVDPAHPAIYPTGEVPKRGLEPREAKIYDLIVRRFFAVFGENAVKERVLAIIGIEGFRFRVSGRRTVEKGWLKYYGIYSATEDNPIPELSEGEKVSVLGVDVNEKFEQHPPRFNQSSLLEKMEKENIGTKTTRADIINTLYERGYVVGESMMATDVGFTVIEAMKNFSQNIVSTEMTREIEEELERVGTGEIGEDEVIERAVDQLVESLSAIKDVEKEIGAEIRKAVISTVMAQNILGPCPVCKIGRLTIIRSRKTRKRFVGCTNYSRGCRASAPLPQRGMIKTTSKTCKVCSWPIVYVRTSRIPWKLCVNIDCPSKEQKRRAVEEAKITAKQVSKRG